MFRASAILLRKWSPEEKTRLQSLYDRFGPAWNYISYCMRGRKTYECEFHYHYRMKPKDLGPLRQEETELINYGYEKYGNQWVDFDVPEIGPTNSELLCREYKDCHRKISNRRLKKFGLTPELKMLVRECFEDFGNDWDRMQRMVKGRSASELKRIVKNSNGKAIFNEQYWTPEKQKQWSQKFPSETIWKNEIKSSF